MGNADRMSKKAPDVVRQLVERFEQNMEQYRNPEYKEARVCSEFIEPLFEALGWDIRNVQGWAEAYKDVIHQDSIKTGGATEAPDYCFRVGGTRKFFVEAKKPSDDIYHAKADAYQLRRYAWSAKLPLSTLTNFQELAVYDCRIRPAKGELASTARIMHLTYEDYLTHWDEIASVFSRAAVLKGSFDRYAESQKRKRGTAAVDEAFLEEIESWRRTLAGNVARRNQKLSQRELNFAVGRTIDRIIFLRMCEDRGIEDYGRLQSLLNGANAYRRLVEMFYRADERYNSGLFHFRTEKGRAEGPDELTPRLRMDDDVLHTILQDLYYPDSPYEFSVLPAEILGHVYEQFLGKVIRLTKGHRAVVDDKPEVRKAGGVYYTPAYIVDYIVQNTVGKLLEDKTPRDVAGIGRGNHPLRVLDPACGSGSFLIGAYQRLLDWHRDWYVQHLVPMLKEGQSAASKEVLALVPSQRRNGTGGRRAGTGLALPMYQARRGEWRLTTAERKRILLTHIFGVDIDAQAVEVTKLSLLLKVLEGESAETLEVQRRMFHERALPDLASNIKCGNSLIGPDFYEGRDASEFTDEERYCINAFDWQAEFPEIFKAGGFDAVIGNPPYVRQESLSDFKDYFQRHYEAFDGVADLYAYFMEQGVKLLRDGGLFSIIVSSSFLRATYGEPLRRTLKKHAAVRRIVDFGGLAVFANAKDTYVCIPLLAKGAKQARVEVSKVTSLKNLKLVEHVAATHFAIPHERISPEAWSLKSDGEAAVFAKVKEAGKPLGEYVERRLFYGIKTGLNDAFIIDAETKRRLIAKDKLSAELIHPLLGGEDIRRYVFHETGLWLIFTRRGVDIGRYPAIQEHLAQWKEDLAPKRDKKAKRGRKPGRYEWYEIQDDVAYYEVFDRPKIIFPDICKGPRFSLDTGGQYLANTAYCLGTDDLYLLGILNSRLFWFAISNISIPFGIRAGKYRYRLIYQYMEKVPIRVIDLSNASDKRRHGQMVRLVEQMLALHRQLAAAKTPHEKTALERQIEATDGEIDRLVYELYGLTQDEVKIVEG